MATIVFGLGTSHTPMLLADDADAAAFRRDRPEHQAPRQGGPSGRPMATCWRRPTRKLADMVAPEHLVARQNKARAGDQASCGDADAGQPRRTDRDGRRPERKLQGGLPAGIRDLLRRHDPQQQRAARELSCSAFPNGTCRTARPSSSRRSRATIRCIPTLAVHLIESADGSDFDLASFAVPAARAKARVTRSPMCIGG